MKIGKYLKHLGRRPEVKLILIKKTDQKTCAMAANFAINTPDKQRQQTMA